MDILASAGSEDLGGKRLALPVLLRFLAAFNTMGTRFGGSGLVRLFYWISALT